MPCTGTEEECRRRCILNPESCGGPPPAFATQRKAMESWLRERYPKHGQTEHHYEAKLREDLDDLYGPEA